MDVADPIDPPDPAEAYGALQEEIAQLRQQLAAARAAGDTTTAELTELREQLATAQRELERLRTPAPPAPSTRRRLDGFYEVEENNE